MDQIPKLTFASEEQIKEAFNLVLLAGFVEPDERLACEAIINTHEKTAVESMIVLLQKLIDDKELAYRNYVNSLKG